MRITLETENGETYQVERSYGEKFVASLASVAQCDRRDPSQKDQWVIWPIFFIEERLYFNSLESAFDHVIAGWWLPDAQ